MVRFSNSRLGYNIHGRVACGAALEAIEVSLSLGASFAFLMRIVCAALLESIQKTGFGSLSEFAPIDNSS
jgi:hypothetical protein